MGVAAVSVSGDCQAGAARFVRCVNVVEEMTRGEEVGRGAVGE